MTSIRPNHNTITWHPADDRWIQVTTTDGRIDAIAFMQGEDGRDYMDDNQPDVLAYVTKHNPCPESFESLNHTLWDYVAEDTKFADETHGY